LGYEIIVDCGLLHCSMKKAASMGGFFVWLAGAFGQVSDMKNPAGAQCRDLTTILQLLADADTRTANVTQNAPPIEFVSFRRRIEQKVVFG
jgi:hypothetical protein